MMLTLSEFIDIEAPADRVWAVVGDFADPLAWTPGATAVDCAGNQPGAVRLLRLGDSEIREQLVVRDPAAGELRYRWLGGALPLSAYEATLRVHPLSAGGTRVTWSAIAAPRDVTAAQLERLLRNAYRRGLLYLAGGFAPVGCARGGAAPPS